MIPIKIGLILLLTIQWGHCGIWNISPSPYPPQPPQPDEVAKMARYIMRNSDWVSIATTSTQQTIQGYPYVTLKSVSDGPPSNSTGVPYLYMTDKDVSTKDLLKDNRCTILATLAESEYCKQKNFDPQDPPCPKVILTGKMVKVDKNSSEYKFGQDALFSKHPEMKWWPKSHGFYVAKINIEKVGVLDNFGAGLRNVSVEDYFNAYNDRHGDVLFNKMAA